MFQRYAIYYTPEGPLAELGAAWLGWDIAKGVAVRQANLDIHALTEAPRRYGFHGTIKPPFRLAAGKTPGQLQTAFVGLCTDLAPVTLDGLHVSDLSGFIALTLRGDQTALAALAAQVVTQLDMFRAAPTEAELARRRKPGLTQTQEQNLINWGYPYVMEAFRFHMTLTGRIETGMPASLAALRTYFAPYLPAPFEITGLTLVGEDADGMFHEIHRAALTG